MIKRLCGVVIVLVSTASWAHAQGPVGCGEVEPLTDIWQLDERRAVGVYANTTRSLSPCPLTLQTEVWIVGSGGAAKNAGAYASPVRFDVGVPDWNKKMAESKHWTIWAGSWWDVSWELFAFGRDETEMIRPPQPDCSVFNGGGDYYEWSDAEERCIIIFGSPLLVDPAHDGFKLTSAEDGVLFDLTADGVPEQVAWTRKDSDDAFITRDIDGNGTIDSGAEMYGNHTLVAAGVRALNGFEALKFLDPRVLTYLNGDFPAFGQLLLWTDANHNGFSEADELVPFHTVAAAISTEYQEKKKRDQFGNEFRQKGTLTWLDGKKGVVYDVWLRMRE